MKEKRKKVFIGNWKMNGTLSSLTQIKKLCVHLEKVDKEVILCPPTTILKDAISLSSDSSLLIGAQNCHFEQSGSYTGEISAQMLSDLGVSSVILGHSERRENNFENNLLIRKKVAAAHDENLRVILCVGENNQQKNNNETKKIILKQIKDSFPLLVTKNNFIIAYEPIWAIGTGVTPTAEEIERIHRHIRSIVAELSNQDMANKVKIVYGGSVKPYNSKKILSQNNVDGALVGGASLLSSDFLQIISSTSN